MSLQWVHHFTFLPKNQSIYFSALLPKPSLTPIPNVIVKRLPLFKLQMHVGT